VLPSALRRTWRSIAWQAAREPMFVLLLAAGLLYLVLGDLREGILMFALVLATLGMTLYEEGKADRAPEAIVDLCHLDPAAAAPLFAAADAMAARGLRVLAVATLGYWWALGAMPRPQARAFAFTVLVTANVGLIFTNRSHTLTVFEALRQPNGIAWIVGGAALCALAAAL
jgi:hypothetical protein